MRISWSSPAFWGRTTSTVEFFKEAISADLRFFRSVSALSRLNTQTHTMFPSDPHTDIWAGGEFALRTCLLSPAPQHRVEGPWNRPRGGFWSSHCCSAAPSSYCQSWTSGLAPHPASPCPAPHAQDDEIKTIQQECFSSRCCNKACCLRLITTDLFIGPVTQGQSSGGLGGLHSA